MIVKKFQQKKNPLKNWRVMMRLNPYANVQKRAAQEKEELFIKKKLLAKEINA